MHLEHTNATLFGPVFLLCSVLTTIDASASPVQRWYTPQQVEQGQRLFQQHCAGCHGQQAESTAQWKQPDANGHFPPPPLNGSAHAWHHDLPMLRKQVREGGQKLGGLMPPFAGVLNAQQIDRVIAFFQSLWAEETYQKWAERFNIAAHASSAATDDASKKPNTRFLRQRLGDYDFGDPAPTPMDGMYRIRFGDKTLYLSRDGRFAFIGDMIDLENGINLGQQKGD